ncbi:MAG: Ti-type conjugative transfer relaxase TraA [Acidimicrobiales bacterium]|nr:Ti-type conjugative transfer relaxase TraA [Acidimicrobiales bacterium]
MLTLYKLAPGQHAYYLDTVARGAEEYYTRSGEVPGEWKGRAAARLGLAGEVTEEQLGAVLDGAHPGGWRLTGQRSDKRVPGFDCTFCAPKSVSLLFALAPVPIRSQVRQAHDAAVDAALAVLEDEAAKARRGKGGLTQVDADGLVAAAFRHRTSRAGDPQLHTHVLVANLAHVAAEDRWSALDGRQLYSWSKTVGYLYEAQLRVELTRRLGVSWDPVTNGIADIAGIPRNVLRHFSQRREQIEAHLAATGGIGAKAAQAATYATRTAKDTTTPYPELVRQWTERAAALGIDERTLAAVCAGPTHHEPTRTDSYEDHPLFVRLALPSGLTERRSTFGRREVIQGICERLEGGADTDEVLALADAFLDDREHVVPLVVGDVERIRRADGTTAPVPASAPRYTTQDMLDTEADLLLMATGRRASGAGLAHSAWIDHAIDGRPTLHDEQAAVVRRICGSGDGVDIVEGVAGAGKTYALAAANEAWTGSGRRVIGAALAARAAAQLQEGSGIPSSTIDRLLADLERPGGGGLGPEHVVVVDEAAMVGTRKLVRLVEAVHAVDAKLVLIGDPCQLPEIEAGGAFAGISRRTRAAALTVNRRQHESWERQALSDVRHGHVEEAFGAYASRERLHAHDSGDAARTEMVDTWWTEREAGIDVLMLAARHRDITDLNDRARELMRSAGRLGEREVEVGERCFAVGDEVLALRNDYRLDLVNGTRGTVEAIDERSRSLRVTTTTGRQIDVPFAYVEDGNLTHGYALTIHKAQGLTTDRALILADDSMAKEHLYTALSRGRDRNDLYLAVDNLADEFAHTGTVRQDPVDALVRSLERSAGEDLAIEHFGLER